MVGVARTRIVAAAARRHLEPPADRSARRARARVARARRGLAARRRARAPRDRPARRLSRRVEDASCRAFPTPGLLADLIASTLPLPPEERIALLEEAEARRSGSARVAEHLEREVTIAETQRALSSASGDEQMDPGAARAPAAPARCATSRTSSARATRGIREVEELREKIDAAKLPEVARAQADRELQRLSALPAARARPPPDPHLPRVARRPAVVGRDRGQARPRRRAHACSTTTTTASRR